MAASTHTLGSDHPETVTALMMLALAVQQSRDPSYALTVTERGYRATLAQYHSDARHSRVIEAERYYGVALANAGLLPEALNHIRTAVSNASAVFGTDSRMTGLDTVDLARVELQHGEVAEALAHSRSAVDIVASHSDQRSYRYANALSVRGDALLAAGHARDAVDDLGMATEILNETLGPTHPFTQATAATLAQAQLLKNERSFRN